MDDSTNDPIYMAGHSVGWRDWQRREDYYSEGVLLWLDVDARLRELTHERAGIDDFARRFFSSHDSSRTYYVFDDICTTLDSIAQSDWSTFLRNHLETHDAGVAMAGLARSGWRLVYKPTPSSTYLQDQGDLANLDYSIGLQVDTRGRVMSVVWGGPAFSAGLAPGDQIIRVNDHDFSVPTLIDAVANSSQKAIGLTFEDDETRTGSVLNYRGPLRYPALERIPLTTDRLTRLLNSAK